MTDSKTVTMVYPKSQELILNAIHDLVELQRAEETYDDLSHGIIHFRMEMYSFSWEYRFTVEKKGESRSTVTLEIVGEATDKKDRIRRQFALLESMIPGGVRADPAGPELPG